MYNGNYRLFSIVSAYIEIMATGLVNKRITFHTFKMEMYATATDKIRVLLEVLVLLFVAINFLNEMKEMLWDGRKRVRSPPLPLFAL